MILDGFYDDARSAIRAQFLGKRVDITECATTATTCLEWASGIVVDIQFGSFGYEGEGDAIFRLEDVTDAGRMIEGDPDDWNSYGPVTVIPKDRKCEVMISNRYTRIDIVDPRAKSTGMWYDITTRKE